MTPRRRRLAVVAAAALALALGIGACGDGDAADRGPSRIEVTGTAIVLPAGANSAVYFTVVNSGTGSDRLVEARTPVGEAALHETRLEDGLMTMHHLDSVPVGPGETVVFRPGGLHVMVHDVDPLVEGEVVAVELVFDQAGVIEVEAVVRTSDALIDG